MADVNLLAPGTHAHIVGIGGSGMSAVARILLDSGITVSGSDQQRKDAIRVFQRDGATIYEGHAAENVSGASVVLISSAIKDDNPEIQAARAAGIPILKRREFLQYLLPDKIQICVAGTHGKTTTTALIIHLLRETGQDPSYIVGGTLLNSGDNAHVGKGNAFVVEADEYDYMFLGLRPKIAVITNIEYDHPDLFPNIESVIEAFRQFVALVPFKGAVIGYFNDANVRMLLQERHEVGGFVMTYGFDTIEPSAPVDQNASVYIGNGQTGAYTYFDLKAPHDNKALLKQLPATLAGQHNVANSLAALAAVTIYGVPLPNALVALKTFQGTGRRFEIVGQAGTLTVVSDYGHHPTAIRATLQAARQRYPGAAIWAVWQPHTYSRTRLLAHDFAQAFGDAEHVLVTDIYAARERPGEGDPTAADLVCQIQAADHADARHSGNLEATAALLIQELRGSNRQNIVIIFSAGDAPTIGEMLLATLRASA